MPKTELDRVKVKILDNQFEYILKELLENLPTEIQPKKVKAV